MAERFFNIPLGRVPALVEAQNFLRRTLPPDTTFVDPDQFHVTLVFVEEDRDIDLSADNPAADLPVFGIGGFAISSFDTQDPPGGRFEVVRGDATDRRYAVHVMIERNPALQFLQSALYYRAEAAGTRISRHSFPGRWRPHITLAYARTDPAFIDLPVPIHLEVSGFALSGENFTSLAAFPLRTDVSVQEFIEQHTEAVISEGSNLARMLNRRIDRDPRERPEVIKALASAASIKPNTVDQILNSSITCPPIERLRGFARALDIKEDTVLRWAREDGCTYPDTQMDGGSLDRPLVAVFETREQVNGRERVELTFLSEMKGQYPNIPLPPDINRDELLREAAKVLGDDPKFVTLPVGQIDARSRNNRRYRQSAMEQFSQQINEMRPEGTFGHTRSEDLATEYKPPAIRWLASTIDETGTVWAKGLPLTKETHDHFKLARATNSRTGTSLQAWADVEGEDVIGLQLIKLDIADPTRVGVPMTAAKPHLSAEMTEGDPDRQSTDADATGRTDLSEQSNLSSEEQTEDTLMGNEGDRVIELQKRTESLQELVDTQRTEIKALKAIQEQYEDIREILDLPDDADVVEHVRQTVERHKELASENIRLLDEAMKAMIEESVQIESVRPVVMELVRAEKPTTKRALEKSVREVVERDYIKALLERELQSEMGPAQGRSTHNDSQDDWQKYLAPKPTRKSGGS